MIETATVLSRGDAVRIRFPELELPGSVMWTRERFAGIQTSQRWCPDAVIHSYALSWDRLLWEHSYVELLGAELATVVARCEPGDGVECHSVRQRFSQALRAHLKHEDWAVYPALRRSSDPDVARTAFLLDESFGDLEEYHGVYTRRWISHAVQDAWPEFRSETQRLLQRVCNRSSREDIELYLPLSENKLTSPFSTGAPPSAYARTNRLVGQR